MHTGLIGNKLRALRTQKNLTQWNLAKKAKLTTGAVWILEHNRRAPTYEEIVSIAEALEVTENELKEK